MRDKGEAMGLTFSSFPWLAASLLSPCVVWLQMLTHLRSGRHFEVFEVKKKKSLSHFTQCWCPWVRSQGSHAVSSVGVELSRESSSFPDTQGSFLKSRRKKASSINLKSMKRKVNRKMLAG